MNYTGNKHRLLPDIFNLIEGEIKVFVDLFSGGGSVGLNSQAKTVYFIDKNPHVIGLLEFLYKSDYNKLLKNIFSIIDKYKLTCTYKNGYEYYRKLKSKVDNNGYKEFNNDGFLELRRDYNALKNKTTSKSFEMLYVLMLYSFNNDIRFNSSNEFNLPCGKTDLNKSNVEKLENFVNSKPGRTFHFLCGDFREDAIKKIILKADVVYADPPYIITTAVYNENNGWNTKDEEDLLELLKERIDSGKKTILSNVLSKKDRVNTILKDWINSNKYKYKKLDYHYKSASYNKINRDGAEQEVLVYGG